jgi:hypothetical protein
LNNGRRIQWYSYIYREEEYFIDQLRTHKGHTYLSIKYYPFSSFDGSGDLSMSVGINITDASRDLIISVGHNIKIQFTGKYIYTENIL